MHLDKIIITILHYLTEYECMHTVCKQSAETELSFRKYIRIKDAYPQQHIERMS